MTSPGSNRAKRHISIAPLPGHCPDGPSRPAAPCQHQDAAAASLCITTGTGAGARPCWRPSGMPQSGRPEGGNGDPAYLLLSRSIVAKLQFSDLIVPIAEIAWKRLKSKELAKQHPRTAVIRVVVLRGGLSGDPEEFSRAVLALGVQAGPRSRRGLHRVPDGRRRPGRSGAGEERQEEEARPSLS